MRTLYAEGERRKRRKIVFAGCVRDEKEECAWRKIGCADFEVSNCF